MTNTHPSRRAILQAGGALGLAAALAPALSGTAHAAPGGTPVTGTTITDLGPALVQFSLMSSVVVGDIAYIGSRNILPARVVAFHLPTRKVIGHTNLTTGYAIQAMVADPTGRYLYLGVLQKGGGPQPNLHRWDLTTLNQLAQPVGRIADRDVRDMAVAPDGVVFAVGGGSPTAPALWQYDPVTGQVTNLGVPDASATLARAVAATTSAVFFGAGSTLGGGGTTSRASLFAYDRAAGGFTNITPTEMLADPSMRELSVIGDRLVAGSAGGTEPAKIAIMDLADTSRYALARLSGKVTKNYAANGDSVYYAAAGGLEAISLSTTTVSQVPFSGPGLGEIWGLDVHDGRIVVVSGYGFVAEIDPATGTCVTTDLETAGAPADPQAVMGIAAGGGFAYVGGNGSIARHSLGPVRERTYLQMPGEAKDAEVINGVLYTGQYSSGGIWRYDPSTDHVPRQVAAFPGVQNRPLDTCWDPVDRRLLVAVQSDTEGGGALWSYDPATGASTHFANPIDSVQLVRAVATRNGTAFLGGDNAQKTGPRGTIVAFDVCRGRELWRIETAMEYGVGSLAVHDKHLYAMTLKGGFLVIDLRTRKIVHTADLRATCPQWSAMLLNRGRIYAASDTTLMRFDCKTFAMTVVAAQLNGGWYSGCHLNNDEHGLLYTMRGTNLVMVDDR
ncbi:outer membrane protein assembly factor BamB family protein [Longispora urticae]